MQLLQMAIILETSGILKMTGMRAKQLRFLHMLRSQLTLVNIIYWRTVMANINFNPETLYVLESNENYETFGNIAKIEEFVS